MKTAALPRQQPPGKSPAFQPLYRQIKALITQSLVTGEWRPGEPIPSEIELAGRYSVSQGTVRKAVGELAEERVLVRQQGKGTFVATYAEERSQFPFLSINPDAEPMRELGAELLGLERMRDPVSARLLGMNATASVFVLRRILKINERPACYEEIRLPAARFRGLTTGVVEQHECMLYSMYEARFGVRMLQAEERVKAVAAPPEVAAALHRVPGTPMLQIERVAFTYGREPSELRRCYCDSQEHHYRNAITG
ncbi:MAG: GntR family transcriptional regulator [Burkholderiales bacterium]|nr:GntR family transcriptional regulator [Burkholderiales bacterium]